MVSGRATEINDFSPVVNEGNRSKNDLLDEARSLTFAPITEKSERKSSADDNQSAAGDQSIAQAIESRARRNADNPDVQKAYKEFQSATKDLDPKTVEDCLNLASDLAESGIKLPGMLKAEGSPEQKSEQSITDGTANEIALSGMWQTLMRKFTNPLVIKDVINIGKDLAQIAMSPQGRQLIADFRSLIVHLKEA